MDEPVQDRISPDLILARSEDVVMREINGELLIIPLVAGIGDLEEELYSLNDTAKAIVDKVDGVRSVSAIIAELEQDYQAEPQVLAQDVLGLLQEMCTRKLLVVRGSVAAP